VQQPPYHKSAKNDIATDLYEIAEKNPQYDLKVTIVSVPTETKRNSKVITLCPHKV
jgi:hypothetical protein